jgi:hypothetical protein
MPFYCGKRSVRICVVLGSKKSSTCSSDYASGFFEPCAARLPKLLCLATKDYSDRLLALPAKRDSFFQGVVERLSGLRRHNIRGF